MSTGEQIVAEQERRRILPAARAPHPLRTMRRPAPPLPPRPLNAASFSFANNTCLALCNQINDRSPPFIENSGSHMKIENTMALADRVCMSRNNMRNPRSK